MRTVKSILLTLSFALAISTSLYASTFLTVTTESKKSANKYTLRNLSLLTHKTSTFYTLKSSLEFKGMTSYSNLNINAANYLKYNKGNISYVIPYRFKVVLPRFKTPTAVQP